MEDSKFVFEAKTIQRMEILILSTLQWKMNPVTPLSFIDYVTRRLGLKNHSCWEFLRRCERLLLSVISGIGINHHHIMHHLKKEKKKEKERKKKGGVLIHELNYFYNIQIADSCAIFLQ